MLANYLQVFLSPELREGLSLTDGSCGLRGVSSLVALFLLALCCWQVRGEQLLTFVRGSEDQQDSERIVLHVYV